MAGDTVIVKGTVNSAPNSNTVLPIVITSPTGVVNVIGTVVMRAPRSKPALKKTKDSSTRIPRSYRGVWGRVAALPHSHIYFTR